MFYLWPLFFILRFVNESQVKYPYSGNLTSNNDTEVYKEPLDTANSFIFWKGTKLLYTRGHSGEVEFKKGEMHYENERLVGGLFEADMKTIKVTDIPVQDISPYTNFTKITLMPILT